MTGSIVPRLISPNFPLRFKIHRASWAKGENNSTGNRRISWFILSRASLSSSSLSSQLNSTRIAAATFQSINHAMPKFIRAKSLARTINRTRPPLRVSWAKLIIRSYLISRSERCHYSRLIKDSFELFIVLLGKKSERGGFLFFYVGAGFYSMDLAFTVG